MKKNKIIQQVKNNYSIIASSFYETRNKAIWPELAFFLKKVKPKSKVLDLGCGNARIYKALKFKKIDYLGVDFVDYFIKKNKITFPKAKFINIDLTNEIALKKIKAKFDYVFLIAVLHHVPDRETQIKILRQVKEKLKKNGILIITVWNLWTKKFWPLHFKQVIKKLTSGFKLKWLWVPYKLTDGKIVIKNVERLCYCFTLRELKNLVKKAGLKIITEKTGHNLCLEAKK